MKRILSVLLCAVMLIMPMCACGGDDPEETVSQTDADTGAEWVDDLFSEAELLYSWFTGCNKPQCAPGSTVQSGDAHYTCVTEPGLNSTDDLRARLSSVFSESIVNSLMETVVYSGAPMFRDIDGALYCCSEMQGKVPWDIGIRKRSITSQSENEIIYHLEMTYAYYASTFTSSYDYRIVCSEDGQWRFTAFRLPALLIAEAMFQADQE